MTSDFAIGRRGGLVEMVVTGRWSGDAESALTAGGVESLVLNYALGFEEPTLDFLRGLPIRQLVVLDRRLTDLDPLYSLSSSLESLRLTTDPSLVLDVSAFGRLAELGADWAQVRASVGGAIRLRKLFLTRYGWDDFTPLSGLRELMALTLKDRPKLRSLNGLAELVALRLLGVFLAKELPTLAGLSDVPLLEELQLQGCRKLVALDEVETCTRLEFLNVGDCGDIASVTPLRRLSRLEFLYAFGSTRILDDDLTPIADLPRLKELRMQSRRAYKPSVGDIQAQIASRVRG